MNTSKIIGAALLVMGLTVGYLGFKKISDNTSEVKVLGLEINASNESGKQEGYIYLGVAAILLSSGIYTLNKNRA
jgi:hypothetical protein